MYNEIEGDLISLAKEGIFNVIAHGCNCFGRMKRGIAPQMAEAFGCDKFALENKTLIGKIQKLGNIDFSYVKTFDSKKQFAVVNCYTQYNWNSKGKPFDYEAFILCLKKINHIFKGEHIGLPMIGAGLSGGEWWKIKVMIVAFLSDMDVTVVKLPK